MKKHKNKDRLKRTYDVNHFKIGDIVICTPPLIGTRAYDEFLDETRDLRLRKGVELKVLNIKDSGILVEIPSFLLTHFRPESIQRRLNSWYFQRKLKLEDIEEQSINEKESYLSKKNRKRLKKARHYFVKYLRKLEIAKHYNDPIEIIQHYKYQVNEWREIVDSLS